MSDIAEVFGLKQEYADQIKRELNPKGLEIPQDTTHLAGCYDDLKEQEKIIKQSNPKEFVPWADYFNDGRDALNYTNNKKITDERIGSYA